MPLHMSEDERVEGPLGWSVFKATTPNEYLSRLPAHNPISPMRPGRLPTSPLLSSASRTAKLQSRDGQIPEYERVFTLL